MASEMGSPMQSICTANPIKTADGGYEKFERHGRQRNHHDIHKQVNGHAIEQPTNDRARWTRNFSLRLAR